MSNKQNDQQGVLSFKQYKQLNKQNFVGLSKKEVRMKYADYLLRRDKNEKPQTAQPKKNKQAMKLPKQVRPQQTESHISECTLKFIKATIDPFDSSISDPCIPDNLSAPSFKFSTVLMATLEIGTTGVGFALYNPYTAAVNDNGVSPTYIDYPLLVTSSTYSFPDVVIDPALVGTQLIGVNSNSYFNTGGYKTATQRVVAGGIEIFYTGNLLNQAGVITTLMNDGGQPFVTPGLTSAIMTNPRARVCANNKDSRCYISYFPTNATQLSYTRFVDNLPSTPVTWNGYNLIILITGATPGTTFQVVGKSFYEAQIPGLSATPSESDPVGYAAFNTARNAYKATDDPTQDLRTLVNNTAKAIGSTISGYGPALGTAVGAAFGQPALGSLAGSFLTSAVDTLISM